VGALVKIPSSCGCLKLKSQTVDLSQLWEGTQGGGRGGENMGRWVDIFLGRADLIKLGVYSDVVRRDLSEYARIRSQLETVAEIWSGLGRPGGL